MRLLKVVFGVFMVMAINCVFVFSEGQQIFALTVPPYVAPSAGYQSQPVAPQYGQPPSYAPQPGVPQYGTPPSAYPNAGATPQLGYPAYGMPQPSYYYPLEDPDPAVSKSATAKSATGKPAKQKETAPLSRKKTGRPE